MRILWESTFVRRVSTLAIGTAAAQLIPFAASPILTRLYDPADFGLFALFLAIISITGILATARYELAIPVIRNEHQALNMTAATIGVAAVVSTALLVLCVPALMLRGHVPAIAELGTWILVIPISTFAIGTFQALSYLAVHDQRYGVVARANVIRASIGTAVQVVTGLVAHGPLGLVLGSVASFLSGTTALSSRLRCAWRNGQISVVDACAALRRYSAFPRLSLPSALTNSATYALISFAIFANYGAAALGFYLLVQRVITAPTQVIGAAIGQVYLKTAASQVAATGSARRLYDKVLLATALSTAVPFALAAVLVQPAFELIFGGSWSEAGVLAQILMPLAWIQFLAAPLSLTGSAYERQGVSFAWQSSLFATAVFIVLGSNTFSWSQTQFFVAMSGTFSLCYLAMIVVFRSIGPSKNALPSGD